MTLWFAFENDGHVYELNGLAEKELAVTGAYGYATEQSALDHRNKPANPAQATLLSSFVVDASLPFGGGMAGVLQVLQTSAPPQDQGRRMLHQIRSPIPAKSGLETYSADSTWPHGSCASEKSC